MKVISHKTQRMKQIFHHSAPHSRFFVVNLQSNKPKKHEIMEKMTRRDFIKYSGVGAAAFMVVPNTVLGKRFGHVAPSDRLNIAGVGVGGMGRRNLRNMSTENIVAPGDVDWP